MSNFKTKLPLIAESSPPIIYNNIGDKPSYSNNWADRVLHNKSLPSLPSYPLNNSTVSLNSTLSNDNNPSLSYPSSILSVGEGGGRSSIGSNRTIKLIKEK